jgi:hypothetical protein
MQDLIIRDVRLLGGTPAGKEVLEVFPNSPIDWPVRWAVARSAAYGGNVCLKILAHGFEQRTSYDPLAGENFTYAGGFKRPVQIAGYSQGGAGIQFCKENIRLGTLDKFSPLNGKIKAIDLMACGAAYITPGFEGKDGDGNFLCYRLAQITHTYLRASTATQIYFELPTIEFGAWEGTVITYTPEGGLYKAENGAVAPTSCPAYPVTP